MFIILVEQYERDALTELVVKSVSDGLGLEGVFGV
jgi:hypothetical protein